MYHHLQFDGLDETDQRVLQHRDDLGYVTVHEVLDRNRNEQLGRVYFNAVDLAPFLAEEPDEGGELGDLSDVSDGPSSEDLAHAASRWMRHVVATNMVGRAGPKGEGQFHSARFVCRNLEVDDTPPLAIPAPTVVPPQPTIGEALPEGRVWRALGEGYTHLIGLLQQSYAHLATLQNTTISNQNQQIHRLQRVLEELMGELTKMRVGIAEVDVRRREDDGETKVREELGKQFISELGTFGRVVAAAKFGMAPELVELAEIVNASPELMEAMKSPEVKRLLKDEKTRKELAELLMMAAKSPPAANQTPPAASAAA